MPSNLSLCHVFVFVKPGAPEATGLYAAGMVESYRRRHPGQGTANVCFCFDNAFLELLWVTSEAEVTSPPSPAPAWPKGHAGARRGPVRSASPSAPPHPTAPTRPCRSPPGPLRRPTCRRA